MNIKVEIDEIESFINASSLDGECCDTEKCLERITEVTNEDFLDDRAKGIRAMCSNPDFSTALKKLSTKCNEKEKNCLSCPITKYCNAYINRAREDVPNDALTMIDLFCGAGGLSLGFSQEGFYTVVANDIEECCVDTYAHNHPETPRDHIIKGDIRLVVDELDNLVGGREIDVVVGGPPCQGFSMANRQRLIDDPRNKLYRNYVEVVRRTNPRFFVMENVKGMLSVADQVVEDFENIGYSVKYQILNAKDFGVPQNRERLIYIGNRVGIDNNIVFNRISEISKTIPEYKLEHALFGLRSLEASQIKNATDLPSEESGRRIERKIEFQNNDYLNLINQGIVYDICLNHKARYNNPRDIEIFGRLEPGDRSDDPKIADIMPYARRNDIFKDKYYKLDPKKVCKTITAHMKFDCNMYIHPYQARGLTPREAARVQSYPDDYYFRGAYTKTFMQIGNSVPPLLGRAIAEAVRETMDGITQ